MFALWRSEDADIIDCRPDSEKVSGCPGENALIRLMQDSHCDWRFVSALHWKSFVTLAEPPITSFYDLDTDSYGSQGLRNAPDLTFQQRSIESVGSRSTDKDKKEETGESAHGEGR
jgi:hypothetical protein